jgi:flagellar export protein FliJ
MAGMSQSALQTLQKLRRRAEQAQMRALAAQQRAMNALHDREGQLNAQIGASLDEARTAAGHSVIDVQTLSRQRFWTTRLQREVQDNRQQIRATTPRLEEARAALVAASRDLKVVQKLGERMRLRAAAAAARIERVNADEHALQQYLRKRRSSR